MSKERLEEHTHVGISMSEYQEYKELKKRVQELEEENRRVRQMRYHEAYEQGKFYTNMKVWYELPKLEQQNKRYREALEEIINARNHFYATDEYVFGVEGIARKALEE